MLEQDNGPASRAQRIPTLTGTLRLTSGNDIQIHRTRLLARTLSDSKLQNRPSHANADDSPSDPLSHCVHWLVCLAAMSSHLRTHPHSIRSPPWSNKNEMHLTSSHFSSVDAVDRFLLNLRPSASTYAFLFGSGFITTTGPRSVRRLLTSKL